MKINWRPWKRKPIPISDVVMRYLINEVEEIEEFGRKPLNWMEARYLNQRITLMEELMRNIDKTIKEG